eukprot:Skav208594  [mRNA]  locus=scaffold3715:89317:104196:+ [translate_table: standard]
MWGSRPGMALWDRYPPWNHQLPAFRTSEVTSYHVLFEAWDGFTANQELQYIRRNYASVAPINKGNMGYEGLTTMYIPQQVQQQAYSTAGEPLEFYRNWILGMWEVWAGGGSGGRRRLENVDGYTWLHWLLLKCTPCGLVGHPSGNGWGAEEFMQKYTMFNMPVAVGVAATWDDYTQIPLSGDIAMYWWTPDPSFLDLAPLPVAFPQNKPAERSKGILLSQDAAASIDTYVSADLSLVSPLVEKFADNLELTLGQMDAILVDQKTTGDSWEEVTCRWVKANEATWRKWIPDESECYPGFGLYDSVLNEFTDERINATNKIVCEARAEDLIWEMVFSWINSLLAQLTLGYHLGQRDQQACPPGTYSEKLADGKKGSGETYICLPCDKGTSQASGAQMSCKPCKTGSISISDCGCPEKTIDLGAHLTGPGRAYEAYECVQCSAGMSCPALSNLVAWQSTRTWDGKRGGDAIGRQVDLQSGKSANGDLFTPKILPGFYSTKEEATQAPPLGHSGDLALGLMNRRSSNAATWSLVLAVLLVKVTTPGAWKVALQPLSRATATIGCLATASEALAICGIFGFLTLAYYLTTSKAGGGGGGHSESHSALCNDGFLRHVGDVDAKPGSDWCDDRGLARQSESIRYLLSALIFPLGVAWLALGWAVSRCFPVKYHWDGSKVCSTMGAFLQVGFSTMSATALAPMMCYKHPNDQRSVLKYPGVICGTGRHVMMMITAWILLAVFVLGFTAFCSYAVWKVPSWSAHRKNHLVGALPGLSLSLGFLVVWSSHAGARAFDQLAGGLGHGLSAHSGGLHRHDFDHDHGNADARMAMEGATAERHGLCHLLLHCALGDDFQFVPPED